MWMLHAILEDLFIYKKPHMKFVLSPLFALLCFYNVVAQKIDPAAVARLSPEKQEQVNGYLKQARNSQTTAWVLCIGGGTLAVVGSIVYFDKTSNDVWGDGENPDYSSAEALVIAGMVTALASVPFFINVHNKRDKARAVIYADKGVSIAPQILIPNTRSAGIKFIIPIGK